MHKLIDRPLFIFIGYILVIFFFAFLYHFSPDDTFDNKLSPLESVYFSVITITTLGYGEITPNNDYGMVATSIEAIIGILIIGMFINSSWKRFSEILDAQQSEKIKSSIKESNKNNLLSYYSYLSSVINEYHNAIFELTTPISKRKEMQRFTYDFLFSDLQDMLNPSLRMKYAFDRSVIEIYYEAEEDLIKEFKYILANFGLEEFTSIKGHILNFLNVVHNTGLKDALLQYTKRSKDDKIRTMLIDMIKEHDELPPEQYHKANMLSPLIVLYKSIPLKMRYIEQLKNDFDTLQTKA